jgi:hypothetical protein
MCNCKITWIKRNQWCKATLAFFSLSIKIYMADHQVVINIEWICFIAPVEVLSLVGQLKKGWQFTWGIHLWAQHNNVKANQQPLEPLNDLHNNCSCGPWINTFCWWAFRLTPLCGYYEQGYNKHWCASISIECRLRFLWVYTKI